MCRAHTSMPPKKQTRKKLDLTNLAGLASSITPEPDKPHHESSDSSTQDTQTPDDASESSSVNENIEPSVSQDSTVTTEELAAEPEAAHTVEDVEPNARPQEFKKVLRSETKPLKTLSSVTNANGEVFKPGDKILAKSPWGARVTAEIKTVYQDSEGNDWVQYLPNEEQLPSGWSWLGGCSRATLLLKA